MKIAIVGYDVEGRASYDYFAALGHELTICDQNPDVQVPEGTEAVLGEGYLEGLDRFDLVVRTAGLPPARILAKNPELETKITTQMNEFMRVCPTKNVIGVTGTKGKGTTSTLITRMLEAAGKTVALGGNIGVPPLTFLNDLTPDSWVVLELSSFQLIDFKYSPPIAVCLMVVPEHLDWHADLQEYIDAKARLFKHQTSSDTAIYFAENQTSKQIAAAGQGQKIPYFAPPGAYIDKGSINISGQEVCLINELAMIGKHNWQNACAAVTAVWRALNDSQNTASLVLAMRSALICFTGLEHRIELVREINGVRFYNDSYSSGLHSTKAAVEAIEGKKVMILGGYDRGLDLSHFAEYVNARPNEFRHLLIIGASAERLASTLKSAGYKNFTVDKQSKTMPAIVDSVSRFAEPGDAVVLSPGFASFDLFKNFKDRGEQFKQAVHSL